MIFAPLESSFQGDSSNIQYVYLWSGESGYSAGDREKWRKRVPNQEISRGNGSFVPGSGKNVHPAGEQVNAGEN
jgi:hypothetical protein